MNSKTMALLYFRLLLAVAFIFSAYRGMHDFDVAMTGVGEQSIALDHFGSLSMTLPVMRYAYLALVYVQLFIGMALLVGLFVRLSAFLGAIMVLGYWVGQVELPWIVDPSQLMINYHLIFLGVLLVLFKEHAGEYIGLDALIKWHWSKGNNSRLKFMNLA
jgi:thiosulfate dehydrogenase [quinone] large subunit